MGSSPSRVQPVPSSKGSPRTAAVIEDVVDTLQGLWCVTFDERAASETFDREQQEMLRCVDHCWEVSEKLEKESDEWRKEELRLLLAKAREKMRFLRAKRNFSSLEFTHALPSGRQTVSETKTAAGPRDDSPLLPFRAEGPVEKEEKTQGRRGAEGKENSRNSQAARQQRGQDKWLAEQTRQNEERRRLLAKSLLYDPSRWRDRVVCKLARENAEMEEIIANYSDAASTVCTISLDR
ncbi:hypothetical protein GUITHDRAFT_113550 [Guillardia theta CCMP2712]|uniref:Uncharacterized protein n=1 Tax=Guillardia theta (strain CCMP2712) TaxID=905079 RepID=L1IWS9_GUITC|nr:hypothetical protein GUITHDRAFT_113550 [Guillardia theta CCMP2712]EKX40309.1 hypothetical protein GUITHDRAFT_113550 [Guillardia theta CCMP2712]|eukprot:XP_005827289.1 hypothetical protein GUITHDRAFT_113550 [Guillardia theta CCMP2712]